MKLLRWFVIAITLFSSLGVMGCGEDKWDGKITMWHSYRGEEKAALEKVTERFNSENKEFQVRLLQIPYDAFADKLNNSIPRGKGPDVFIFAHDRIGDWAEKMYLEPLEFLMTDTFRDRFLESTLRSFIYQDEGLAEFIYEGSIYGLPLNFKTLALYYNKKLIKNPPRTTDELVAMAKKHTNSAESRFGLVYDNTNLYFHSPWLYGFGGGIFGQKGEISIDTVGTRRSLQFIRDLYRKHKIMPDEITNTLVTSLFNEGKAAFVINGPWFKAEIKPDVEYGLTTLPLVSSTGKPARPFLTVEGVLMSSHSRHKKESFIFMKYLSGAQPALTLARKGNQISAMHSVYQNKDIIARQDLMVFKDQQGASKTMPNKPDMKKVWTPMDTALSRTVNSDDDIDEILKKAQKEIEEAIRESVY